MATRLAYLSLSREGRYSRRMNDLGLPGGQVNPQCYQHQLKIQSAWNKRNRLRCRLAEARWRQKVRDFTGGCGDLHQAIFVDHNQLLKRKEKKERAKHALQEVRRIQKLYPNNSRRGKSALNSHANCGVNHS